MRPKQEQQHDGWWTCEVWKEQETQFIAVHQRALYSSTVTAWHIHLCWNMIWCLLIKRCVCSPQASEARQTKPGGDVTVAVAIFDYSLCTDVSLITEFDLQQVTNLQVMPAARSHLLPEEWSRDKTGVQTETNWLQSQSETAATFISPFLLPVILSVPHFVKSLAFPFPVPYSCSRFFSLCPTLPLILSSLLFFVIPSFIFLPTFLLHSISFLPFDCILTFPPLRRSVVSPVLHSP